MYVRYVFHRAGLFPLSLMLWIHSYKEIKHYFWYESLQLTHYVSFKKNPSGVRICIMWWYEPNLHWDITTLEHGDRLIPDLHRFVLAKTGINVGLIALMHLFTAPFCYFPVQSRITSVYQFNFNINIKKGIIRGDRFENRSTVWWGWCLSHHSPQTFISLFSTF